MRLLICAASLALAAAAPAPDEDCLTSINEAVALADTLPPSPGRNVVLRDVALARDARHENDQEGCRKQIEETLALLHAQRDGAAAGDRAAK